MTVNVDSVDVVYFTHIIITRQVLFPESRAMLLLHQGIVNSASHYEDNEDRMDAYNSILQTSSVSTMIEVG